MSKTRLNVLQDAAAHVHRQLQDAVRPITTEAYTDLIDPLLREIAGALALYGYTQCFGCRTLCVDARMYPIDVTQLDIGETERQLCTHCVSELLEHKTLRIDRDGRLAALDPRPIVLRPGDSFTTIDVLDA
jgi:hypothetical protein